MDGLCGVQDSLAPLYHAASVYDGGYGVLPGPAAMDFQPPYFPPPYPVPQAPAAATVAADFPLGASCPPAAPRVYYSGVQAGAGRPEPPSTSAVQPSDVGGRRRRFPREHDEDTSGCLLYTSPSPRD